MENPPRRGGPKPRESYPIEGVQQNFDLSRYQQSFDKEAFDALIKSQGVECIHYKAILDPGGMASIGDTHAVQKRRASSDGFIYREAGTFWGSFLSNTANWDLQSQGLIKHDTVQMTPSRMYFNCPEKPVVLGPYDRIYVKNVELYTIANQYVEASASGVDRLQYPALVVENLVDTNEKEYICGAHFEITKDGFIKWLTQERPGFNINTGRGTVYSIRYLYTPYWVVARLQHEIRVSQVTNQLTMERSVERMPYNVILIRESSLGDVNRDPNNNIMDSRYQFAPPIEDDAFPGNKNQGPAGAL